MCTYCPPHLQQSLHSVDDHKDVVKDLQHKQAGLVGDGELDNAEDHVGQDYTKQGPFEDGACDHGVRYVATLHRRPGGVVRRVPGGGGFNLLSLEGPGEGGREERRDEFIISMQGGKRVWVYVQVSRGRRESSSSGKCLQP